MLYLALPSLLACEDHGRNTILRGLPKYFLEAPKGSPLQEWLPTLILHSDS